MAGAPVIHVGENSPEHIAYKLLQDVLSAESPQKWTRQLLLDLYAECLLLCAGSFRNPRGKISNTFSSVVTAGRA